MTRLTARRGLVLTPWALALAFLLSAPAALADDPLPPAKTIPGGGSTARVAPAGPAPRSAVAVSPDYRLSAGDEIEVEVAVPAAAEADNPVREPKKILVGPGGTLDLPKVHGVPLVGRTVGDVQRAISAKLAEAKVATSAEVFVRVVSYAPRYVYVAGAVWDKIEVSPFEPARLLYVLAQTGKALEAADTSRVRVLSPGGTQRVVDVTALLSAGGTSPEGALLPGDIVWLAPRPPKAEPTVERVWVAGAVKSPGSYRYMTGPNNTLPLTLIKALTAAGWLTEYGKIDRVTVRRFTQADSSVRTVNVKRIIEGMDADLILEPDDLVWVPD